MERHKQYDIMNIKTIHESLFSWFDRPKYCINVFVWIHL